MAITYVTKKVKMADSEIIDVLFRKDDSTTPPTYTWVRTEAPKDATLNIQRATTAGTIAAGAISVDFANSGTVNASVAGATIKPGEGWPVPYVGGRTFPAIAYNPGSGGELIIIEVR